ncbi:TIGR01777 family oxidoreductase [Armatimonas sp.]|uniref:TIGR01777 family oxidoreductase n=1 Tax=Armatimonas sp. TaxID=1872638 RepID=UPI00374DB590
MKILIAGASGFIGQPLLESLAAVGHTVQTLSRTARANQLSWDDETAWRDAVAQSDAVINLCGASVAAQRWSETYRDEILYSRVEPTRKLASARPKVLLNASAVGFYGDHGDNEITEESVPVPDYFTHVCARWEEATQEAVKSGGRVVFLRIGQVFARGGGVIESMVNPPQVPFSPWKLGLGGPLGNGRQWVPWIHRDDVLGLFALALENPMVSGPLNAVSPNPVTAQALADALGAALGKPARFPVPLFALRALVGEFADYLVASQRVVPTKALALGYTFRWPTLPEALADVVQ